jgi:hypothetical protein
MTLRIRSVRKVCDFIPARHGRDSIYGPCLLRAAIGDLLFVMGGHDDAPTRGTIDNPNPADGSDPLTGVYRFADKIYMSHARLDGTFGNPVEIIGKAPGTFPWMSDEAFLVAHSEVFIGSAGGPSVFEWPE